MPLPKITGLLNNCALNSALPTLLNVIQQLGQAEARGSLDEFADSPIYQKYQELKMVFADHYGIAREAFNWVVFSAYLNRHSFYANEIIFAPVLRLFIGQEALAGGGYAEGVSGLSEVQDDAFGRYNNLHYLEVAQLFHHQFGISVNLYKIQERTPVLVANKPSLLRDYPFGTQPSVNLYLNDGDNERNGHFEILPPGDELVLAAQGFVEEINTLPQALSEIHEGLSISETAEQSQDFLYQRLLSYVRAGVGALMADTANSSPNAGHRYMPTDFIVSAHDYLDRGAQYHDVSIVGWQALARIVLGILCENGDRQAQTLLDALTFLGKSPDPFSRELLNRLLTSIIRSKADLANGYSKECQYAVAVFQKADNYLQLAIKENLDRNDLPPVLMTAIEILEISWGAYLEQNDIKFLQAIDRTLDLLMQDPSGHVDEFVAIMNSLTAKPTSKPETPSESEEPFASADEKTDEPEGQPERDTHSPSTLNNGEKEWRLAFEDEEPEVHKDQPKKGNYAQRVAGLMLSLLGLVVTAGFAGAYVMGFLLSAPVTLVGMAVGIGITATGYGFFRAGQASGSKKDASTDEIPLSTLGVVS